MNIDEILDEMRKIQEIILNFINDMDNDDDQYEKIQNLLNFQKILKNKNDFILICRLLVEISCDHKRNPLFFDKIEMVLKLFIDRFKTDFTNTEIFNIFKYNKRILLYFINENIINVDDKIVKKISSGKYKEAKYPEYFSPEINQFLRTKSHYDDNIKEDLPENFNDLRKKGENDQYICSLIREDSVEDFIKYINKNNYFLDSVIEPSIYETNSLLLKEKNVKLIEYAVFFGALQIFQFLRLNNVKLTDSLWIYAIHGNNAEILHDLERNQIIPQNNLINQCYKETVKCFNNDIANYIENTYMNSHFDKSSIFGSILKYYNFDYMETSLINHTFFDDLCKYEYYTFVKFLLIDIDIYFQRKIVMNARKISFIY